MRIVYVTDAFAVWGGMERVLADKMNYLVEHYGYNICLLTINQGVHNIPFLLNSVIRWQDLNIKMHQQYGYQGIARFVVRQKLKRLLKKRLKTIIRDISPDIIVCLKMDFVGLLLQLKGKVPLIVESHTLFCSEKIDGSSWLRRVHIWLFKKQVCQAEAIVALTEKDADAWKHINTNVFVIPNVVHLNEGCHFAPLKEKSVIFVGRFSVQKDIESLLKIWEIIHEHFPDWMLKIFGEGNLKRESLSIINSQNLNIYLFDPVANIMDKYMESSVLVLTSLYEPFGLVLPEAMSCGLPVVSFDCPYGPGEIITDGVDGFLVKGRSVESFADKICQLIEDEDLRRKMGQAGIISSKRFSADVIMPQWKALFERLITS